MKQSAQCEITKKELPFDKLIQANLIRDQIRELIQKDNPSWTGESGYVSLELVQNYRHEYVKTILEEERGSLTSLEEEVLESMKNAETLSRDVNVQMKEMLSIGDKLADKVADFGGSWKFIIFFMIVLVLWIIINSFVLISKPFDPYPYILMNLILSCIAALQAPVIMMSQNRQEEKDRLRAQNDFQINLKAEIEIRQLHEKMDHLIIKQGQKLFELQQIQIEMMEQLLSKK
ncbi:MAG: DUF1003 domain-containing protein [Bacteroidales bacterium]